MQWLIRSSPLQWRDRAGISPDFPIKPVMIIILAPEMKL
ncbi:hypothetical protein KP77_11270 [Jeotgalibacillus alimentarius]|uniref:Uncharacterized protein n=1 Tax=Jeotgalibacillus alimentarius TaxID=135826 RepID=A0A0C2RMY9_9BACL|nr:hypothetical protein KP77_11270 [Jeotgalibacillus alimentarius]